MTGMDMESIDYMDMDFVCTFELEYQAGWLTLVE